MSVSKIFLLLLLALSLVATAPAPMADPFWCAVVVLLDVDLVAAAAAGVEAGDPPPLLARFFSEPCTEVELSGSSTPRVAALAILAAAAAAAASSEMPGPRPRAAALEARLLSEPVFFSSFEDEDR